MLDLWCSGCKCSFWTAAEKHLKFDCTLIECFFKGRDEDELSFHWSADHKGTVYHLLNCSDCSRVEQSKDLYCYHANNKWSIVLFANCRNVITYSQVLSCACQGRQKTVVQWTGELIYPGQLSWLLFFLIIISNMLFSLDIMNHLWNAFTAKCL